MKQKGEDLLDLISLTTPEEFIMDFIEYWEEIKKIVNPEGKTTITWKKWKISSQETLEPLTIPFYKKWKHLGIIKWIEAYVKTFSSILLQYKGFSILLPKQLILYEAVKPNTNLILNLKENPTCEYLERIILSLQEDLNIRLMKSDLQIIQKLSQSKFSKSLDRYPKLKELAYGIRRDVRTVSSRLDYLFQHQILSLIYLVDMARIGYQSNLLLHEQPHIPRDIQRYVSVFFPLSSDGIFSTIVQSPFRDIKAYRRIFEYFNPVEEYTMKNQYCGWNISGLTQKPSERWKLLPRILQEGTNWSNILITSDPGVEFNLDPYYDPFPLTHRQARLLGLIHKFSTMEEESLAKQLKINRAYITTDAKTLLRNRVIFRFPLFFNLGLGSWVYFCIRGLTSERKGGLMNILEHLKFFPYINVFYTIEAGVMIGRVRIPNSWTNRFIFNLTSLPKTHPECSSFSYIGPDSYAPWGFDILGTFDWDNYPK